MKTVLKIAVSLLCVGVIVFMGLRLFGVIDMDIFDFSGDDTSENGSLTGEEIARWESEESENGFVIELVFYDTDEVNIWYDAANSFFDMDELYNIDYKSSCICDSAQYDEKGDTYISLVPDTCTGVEMDGTFFESKNAEVTVNGTVIQFKYVMADVEHIPIAEGEHKAYLMDESGKRYEIEDC